MFFFSNGWNNFKRNHLKAKTFTHCHSPSGFALGWSHVKPSVSDTQTFGESANFLEKHYSHFMLICSNEKEESTAKAKAVITAQHETSVAGVKVQEMKVQRTGCILVSGCGWLVVGGGGQGWVWVSVCLGGAHLSC